MKRNLLIAFVFLISITSCKKEKPPVPEIEDRKPEVLIKEITSKLAGADSISTFTAALKNITLTVDETSQGITVFAPLNQIQDPQARVLKMASNGVNAGKTSFNAVSEVGDTTKTPLTDVELKDHIVKGVFNFNNLTNGKVLVSLNGKELKVTRSADTVWINGVRIGGQQIISSNNEAVYAVKSVLTGTTPADELQSTALEITIWDATLWTATKPKGELAANALVTLYKSQKDYADSIPTQQGTTDATGKVVFKAVNPGVYYIKVDQGAKTNIFNRFKQNGLYIGFANGGIFQNQAQVTTGPALAGTAPGDFKWVDINADGVINDNDRVTLPYEKATVTAGALRKVEVLIGTMRNTQAQPFTETEFNTKLNEAEASVALWHKRLVLIDGLLGPRMTMDSVPQAFKTAGYQAINTYGFNASNQYVEEVWRLGYESISKLTTLNDRIPNAIANRIEKIARIRVTRAYIYLQLFTYFENISLIKPSGKLSNTNKSEVYDYIISELVNSGSLSNNVSSATDLNSFSKHALLAKARLLDKQYGEVKSLTEAIIASGKYALAGKGQEFATGSNEIMWDNSVNMDPQTKSYFYNRASLPYIRLTEVYMMAIEANIALGQTSKAQELYATVCNRSGYFVSPVTIAGLSGFFGQQFAREGNLFISTLRWGNSSQLQSRGFVNGKHNRLPIPQSVLDANPDMNQNVQY